MGFSAWLAWAGCGVWRGNMTKPAVVTVPPSYLRMLKMLAVGHLEMVGGIIAIFGLRSITVWACAGVVGLSTLLDILAAVRQRPRVVITPDGFAFGKLFGREAHKWEDIAGRFAVIKVGWSKAVAYNLTPEYKARVGKKPTSFALGGMIECCG